MLLSRLACILIHVYAPQVAAVHPAAAEPYVFGNRLAESGLDRAYHGKREPDHRTSE